MEKRKFSGRNPVRKKRTVSLAEQLDENIKNQQAVQKALDIIDGKLFKKYGNKKAGLDDPDVVAYFRLKRFLEGLKVEQRQTTRAQ